MGVVLRDEGGVVLYVDTLEALASLRVFQFIAHMGLWKLIVESDLQTIVTMLNSNKVDWPTQGAILAYIKCLCLGFQGVEFHHIPHEANSIAHT